jgi:hypothetical protein
MCLANGPLIFGLYFSHILTSGLHSPSFGGTSIGFPVKEVYEYAFATFSQRSRKLHGQLPFHKFSLGLSYVYLEFYT